MQKNKRWMKSVLKEAASNEIAMPWARGKRRTAMIERRNAPVTPRKAASA
ncbi:hypothetical protein [Cochlodiniinecator piscidefendens]|nr:hypothetical protein [Cochlodiniinecator piscidefendens]